MKLIPTLFLATALSVSVHAAPVLRVMKDEPRTNFAQNGDFEEAREKALPPWVPAPNGFELAAGEGRNGSQAIRCQNKSGDGWWGVRQTINLNQINPFPIIVRGWSKAASVTGGADTDYSIYVDLTFTDGTPLWGQVGAFRTGTHDWEQREFVIQAQKPVRSLTLHCLFRNHAGTVWFDDVRLEEIRESPGAFVFEGMAVRHEALPEPPQRRNNNTIASEDHFALDAGDQTFLALRADSRSLSGGSQGGFFARDAARGSDFHSFEHGACPELGLGLSANLIASSNHIRIQGRLSDLTGADRAVTLVCALPLNAVSWTWGDDLRTSRRIPANGELENVISVACGATGTESLYPLGAVWDAQTGVALAIDMGSPAVYRIGYHGGLGWIFIAYDFGLVKESEHFPSSADFKAVCFEFEPSGGFRAALRKYMNIFPDYFAVRSQQQGLWMPFTPVSKVPGWEDFGFRYHEGNNDVVWDDQHGVLSFRYTEPMTWWMSMNKDVPRTLAEAIRVRDEIAEGSDSFRRHMAEVTRVAAMFDDTGNPALTFRDTPWANGAVWSLDPNPWLAAPGLVSTDVKSAATNAPGQSVSSAVPINAATVYWNDSIKRQLYGSEVKGQLDGEYLDSLEGYVTADLNFRREHFKTTTVPLTFSLETKQPALFKGLAVYEFTRWLAEDVHQMGKLMFANGVPYRFTYLCPWLDLIGTETDWLQQGHYHPASIGTMDLWRSMSGAKPYLLLMNTDYDRFTPDLVERYFQRALFYGMWPGFFSHNAADNPYWQNPRWFERDRPLFRKYIPLVRKVAEAGWQPLTGASSTNDQILLERFGPAANGTTYLTLFNDTAEPQTGPVLFNGSTTAGRLAAVEPIALLGDAPKRSGSVWLANLGPQQAAVWELKPAITVHTNFEAGSAGKVEWLGPAELRIHVVGQANELGRNRQANWYYFRLEGVRDQEVTMQLTNFVGEYNFVPGACAMNADTIPVFSEDGENWRHFPSMGWDDQAKQASLRFHSHSNAVWIAHVPPYPLSRLQRLLDDVRHSPYAQVESIGQSIQGRDLHLVTITDANAPTPKKCIWLIARQHAWETGTSFVLEGALRFLISANEQAQDLRRSIVFRVIPTMDPDGLASGHVRFNSAGYDLNRHWPAVDVSNEESRKVMPEIWSVKKAIFAQLDQNQGIDFLLNLHNTETNEYVETQAEDTEVQAKLNQLFQALSTRTSFDPSRKAGISANPADTTNSLWPERKVPAALMEQRIGTSPKLGRRLTTLDRQEFGRALAVELGNVVNEHR